MSQHPDWKAVTVQLHVDEVEEIERILENSDLGSRHAFLREAVEQRLKHGNIEDYVSTIRNLPEYVDDSYGLGDAWCPICFHSPMIAQQGHEDDCLRMTHAWIWDA